MRSGAFLALAVVLGASAAGAQAETYPSRPITFVVPYAAGGGTDLLARLLGQKLEQRLGKPFLVETKGGAGTVIGATFVARAAPDGYTLLMATSTPMAINVTVRKSLPYDPSLPVHSVTDLIKLAKDNPGKLSYASSGPGSFHHLNAELLKSLTGMDIVHVPYRGSLPALNDVVAGHVALMFSDLTPSLPLIRDGKLRPLGVSTAQRVGAAPDIPPLAEVGVPGYDAAAWQMVVAPGATPKEIVNRLNAELRAIASEPEVRDELVNRGMIPLVSPLPDELERFVTSEIERWGKVVRQAGAEGIE